jgi:two-component system, chemotaxis family, chemotaxis protein CheY
MISLDDELAEEYLMECRGHLAVMETGLLDIENGGAAIDENQVNRVVRAVHAIGGGATFFDLVKIHELARRTEDVLALIRSGKTPPTPGRIRVLLRATDKLLELVESPAASNEADIAELIAALAGLPADPPALAEPGGPLPGGQPPSGGMRLRMLLVEDDFASRLVLQKFLSRYGDCHIAVNGREAVDAFRTALERGQPYDLVCMDIMMPEMDGREAVRQIRAMEEAKSILSTYGAKIIMTTGVDDMKEVILCFADLCDAYLTKPIDLAQLLEHMKSFQLVP